MAELDRGEVEEPYFPEANLLLCGALGICVALGSSRSHCVSAACLEVVASNTMLTGIGAEEEGRDAECHQVEADTLLGLLEKMEPEA